MSVRSFELEPASTVRLAAVTGPAAAHLHTIEDRTGTDIRHRGQAFEVTGQSADAAAAEQVLRALYAASERLEITAERVHMNLVEVQAEAGQASAETDSADDLSLRAGRVTIRGRTRNQSRYLARVLEHDLNFGVGPAGTGKTYLAVAAAVEALTSEKVRRVVLVRPAVEAGERLGFLPGDLAQKIDPYLRPLYDALYEMLGAEKVARLQERNQIELAPLAYMRGRSLNESFIILDEAQNTTVEQMKMFLTRIGFGSTAVVTGDISQVDLPRGQRSGLRHALDVLDGVDGISLTHFDPQDVVRHPLVQRIVKAYARAERNQPEAGSS